MGGHCGYLATISAIASGADNAYIFEVHSVPMHLSLINQYFLGAFHIGQHKGLYCLKVVSIIFNACLG